MFELPKLGYAYEALGKYISKDIMELHHSRHHQGYVDKLNAALEPYSELKDKTIIELISGLDKLPEEIKLAVRNQGGGHYNHTNFWLFMSPDGGGQPSGQLADDLTAKYGTFQTFIDQFSSSAAAVFGSGWAWLNKDLSISTSPNQDSPVMEGKPEPLLGLDVWEHAYYLDYSYKRADYINAWWNVVNWAEVARRYEG